MKIQKNTDVQINPFIDQNNAQGVGKAPHKRGSKS